MAERVSPEEAEEGIVFVGCREIKCVLINKVSVVLKAQTKFQRAFVLDFQILFCCHGERTKVMGRWLIEESKLVIIEGPDFRLVFGISSNVSAVLKMLPHERTFVEIANLFRITRLVAVRLIEAGKNCHEVGKCVIVDLSRKSS